MRAATVRCEDPMSRGGCNNRSAIRRWNFSSASFLVTLFLGPLTRVMSSPPMVTHQVFRAERYQTLLGRALKTDPPINDFVVNTGFNQWIERSAENPGLVAARPGDITLSWCGLLTFPANDYCQHRRKSNGRYWIRTSDFHRVRTSRISASNRRKPLDF
jgi:hypothetical protein